VQHPPTNAKPETANVVPAPKPTPVAPATNPPAEIVKLAAEPVIRTSPVDDHSVTTKPGPTPAIKQSPAKSPPGTNADQRSFLSRVNPANLFHKETKPAPRLTPLPDEDKPVATSGISSSNAEASAVESSAVSPGAGSFPRHAYLSPEHPPAGNTREGERLLAQGRREQTSQKLAEAVQSYRAAVATDPGNFDAQFALGYAAFQIHSYKLSTWAWEQALAIHPDSTDARYNFALALRALNCVPDAANELEKVLRMDEKVTKAHLTLGSIYAEQLKDVAKARLHYRRVLDLEPSHPRGAEIRQWLVVNNQP
jgi:hypothetical protein